MKKQGRTIVFVTHDMNNVEQFCDRVLVMKEGKSLGIVDASEANIMYGQLNIEDTNPNKRQNRWGSGEVTIKDVKFLDPKNNKTKNIFMTGDDIRLKIEIKQNKPINQNLLLGLAFYDDEDINISGPNSKGIKISAKDKFVYFDIMNNPFNQGKYSLTAAIYGVDTEDTLDYLDKNYILNITSKNIMHGKIFLDGKWKNENK